MLYRRISRFHDFSGGGGGGMFVEISLYHSVEYELRVARNWTCLNSTRSSRNFQKNFPTIFFER